jgi:hypothetical protein
LDKFDVAEEVAVIRTPGTGVKAFTSPIVPLSRVERCQGRAKSVMEEAVKSQEDLINIVDRFAEDVMYTVSPRAAKKGGYGAESSNKYRTPLLRHVTIVPCDSGVRGD